jgi:hypothetical protein
VDLADEVCDEATHSGFVVMPQPGAGEQLRVGDDRRDGRLATGERADACVGGGMERVVAVEEAGDGHRVEQRYHS